MGIIESILLPDLTVRKAEGVLTKAPPERVFEESVLEDSVLEDSVDVNEVASGVCHYQTGAWEPVENQYLPEDIYSLVLDSIVGSSTSILLLYNDKMLLGKRRRYPQMSWWFPVTGRILPGIIPRNNCQRLCLDKLGCQIKADSRFEFVGTYSYLWRMRNESPKHNGKHEISVVFAINLESSEIPKDYSVDDFSDMKWISIMELAIGDYHPALRRVIHDYQMTRALALLVKEVVCQEKTDFSAIGQSFKLWCSKRMGCHSIEKPDWQDNKFMKNGQKIKNVTWTEEVEEENLNDKKETVIVPDQPRTEKCVRGEKNLKMSDENQKRTNNENKHIGGRRTDSHIEDQKDGILITTINEHGQLLKMKKMEVSANGKIHKLNDENTMHSQERKYAESSTNEERNPKTTAQIKTHREETLKITSAKVCTQNLGTTDVVESDWLIKTNNEKKINSGVKKEKGESILTCSKLGTTVKIEYRDEQNCESANGEMGKAPSEETTDLLRGVEIQNLVVGKENEDDKLLEKKDNFKATTQSMDIQEENLETIQDKVGANNLRRINIPKSRENPIINEENETQTSNNKLKTGYQETEAQIDKIQKSSLEITMELQGEANTLKVVEVAETGGMQRMKSENWNEAQEINDDEQPVTSIDNLMTKDKVEDPEDNVKTTKQNPAESESLETHWRSLEVERVKLNNHSINELPEAKLET